MGAITNGCKLGGLKEQKCTLSQFRRLAVRDAPGVQEGSFLLLPPPVASSVLWPVATSPHLRCAPRKDPHNHLDEPGISLSRFHPMGQVLSCHAR